MAKENRIFTALAPLGFETAGQACFGRWKGYAVSMKLNGNVYGTTYYLIELAVRADKKDKQLLKAVRKAMKAKRFKHYANCFNTGNSFQFMVTFHRKTGYDEQFREYLDAFTDVLRENGVSPACTCALCGGARPESLGLIDSFQPVHSACLNNKASETRETAENNQENGSYLTGLLGAILGMLVGLIPNLLTIWFAERIYALLFALVPLAAMWGYRKFKGKMNKGSIVIVVLLSLLGVFVLEYLIAAIQVAQDYSVGFGLAFAATVEILTTVDGLVYIVENSIMEFVFMVIGIVVAWRYLSQTNASSVKNIEAVLNTLRPNPDFADPTYGDADASVSVQES